MCTSLSLKSKAVCLSLPSFLPSLLPSTEAWAHETAGCAIYFSIPTQLTVSSSKLLHICSFTAFMIFRLSECLLPNYFTLCVCCPILCQCSQNVKRFEGQRKYLLQASWVRFLGLQNHLQSRGTAAWGIHSFTSSVFRSGHFNGGPACSKCF